MKELAELAKDAMELPSPQRLKLARILLDLSEPGTVATDAEEAWEEEIQARVAAVKNGSAVSRPVAEVVAELDQKYPA